MNLSKNALFESKVGGNGTERKKTSDFMELPIHTVMYIFSDYVEKSVQVNKRKKCKVKLFYKPVTTINKKNI